LNYYIFHIFFRLWWPSLIFDLPRHRTAISIVIVSSQNFKIDKHFLFCIYHFWLHRLEQKKFRSYLITYLLTFTCVIIVSVWTTWIQQCRARNKKIPNIFKKWFACKFISQGRADTFSQRFHHNECQSPEYLKAFILNPDQRSYS